MFDIALAGTAEAGKQYQLKQKEGGKITEDFFGELHNYSSTVIYFLKFVFLQPL
jgi:hypothetical protein